MGGTRSLNVANYV